MKTWIAIASFALSTALFICSGRWMWHYSSGVNRHGNEVTVWVKDGGIELGVYEGLTPGQTSSGSWFSRQPWNVNYMVGMSSRKWGSGPTEIHSTFFAPLWPIVAACALIAYRFARRDPKLWRPGCCETCGYPIGSSPTCTECGAAVTHKAAEVEIS